MGNKNPFIRNYCRMKRPPAPDNRCVRPGPEFHQKSHQPSSRCNGSHVSYSKIVTSVASRMTDERRQRRQVATIPGKNAPNHSRGAPMETMKDRLRVMLGDERLSRLEDARVLVFGCGGVGSSCIEALARRRRDARHRGQGRGRPLQHQSPGHRIREHRGQTQGRRHGRHDRRHQPELPCLRT